MALKDKQAIANTIAKYKSSTRSLYRVMSDGKWHTREQLRVATGIAYANQTISTLRKDGINIETQHLTDPGLPAMDRWRYRLLSIVPAEMIDKAIEDRQSHYADAERRSKEWLKGARRGVRAAKIDKPLGVTRENPYKMARGSRKTGWNTAYKTFMQTGEDLAARYGEAKLDKQEETLRAPKTTATKSSYMKDALIDWEFQAKGMTCASTHGTQRIYRNDPTLTEEDRQWAATQAEICRRELYRLLGRTPRGTRQ